MRQFALLLVAAGLAASAWAGWKHATVVRARTMDSPAAHAAAVELRDAGEQLYLTKRWADTFAGPDLRNFRDLQLVRADAEGFCVQVVKDGRVFRLRGPGGLPEPGRCVQ